MLRSQPSLLWWAAQWGFECTFRDFLDHLEQRRNVGMPEYAVGVPTIPFSALKAKHYDVLEVILQKPSLFPR